MRLAGAGSFPGIRPLPEDIVQDSIQQIRIQQVPMETNKFAVRWTYTEEGAKKMLAFWNAYRGEKVIEIVGSFEFRAAYPRGPHPPGWEEGWLKTRTDKFFGISEEDAKKIVEGLRKK